MNGFFASWWLLGYLSWTSQVSSCIKCIILMNNSHHNFCHHICILECCHCYGWSSERFYFWMWSSFFFSRWFQNWYQCCWILFTDHKYHAVQFDDIHLSYISCYLFCLLYIPEHLYSWCILCSFEDTKSAIKCLLTNYPCFVHHLCPGKICCLDECLFSWLIIKRPWVRRWHFAPLRIVKAAFPKLLVHW